MEQHKRTKKRTIYISEGMDRALRFLAYKRKQEVSPLCVDVLRTYIQNHASARQFLEDEQQE